MLSVIMLSGIMLSGIMLSVNMLSVIVLSVIVLSVIMLSVTLLNVTYKPFMLNVIMLSVVGPPICLSLEDVTVHAGHKVLIKADYILAIVDNPQGILNQQLRSCPIQILNTIIVLII